MSKQNCTAKCILIKFIWRSLSCMRVQFFSRFDLYGRIAELISGNITIKEVIVNLNTIEPVTTPVDVRTYERASHRLPHDSSSSGSTVACTRYVPVETT